MEVVTAGIGLPAASVAGRTEECFAGNPGC